MGYELPLLAPQTASWSPLGSLFGRSWAILGPSSGPLGPILGPSWAIKRNGEKATHRWCFSCSKGFWTFEGVLRALREHLEPSCGPPEASWRHVGSCQRSSASSFLLLPPSPFSSHHHQRHHHRHHHKHTDGGGPTPRPPIAPRRLYLHVERARQDRPQRPPPRGLQDGPRGVQEVLQEGPTMPKSYIFF